MPTWRGWLLVVLVGIAGGNLLLRGVYPFLAVAEKLPAKVLVLEGWNPDSVYQEAIAEFRSGGYEKLLVTGGPLDKGSPLSEYKTYAEMGAATLIGFGLKPVEVQAVPAPPTRRDRTFNCAVALATRLNAEGDLPSEINLVSVGPHCRRSRMLFEKALGDGVKVGVIPTEPNDYDPARWWRSSAGFRTVTGEAIAYLYARFLFKPEEER